jgi:hypothetical protein
VAETAAATVAPDLESAQVRGVSPSAAAVRDRSAPAEIAVRASSFRVVMNHLRPRNTLAADER